MTVSTVLPIAFVLVFAALCAVGCCAGSVVIRKKNLHLWLPSYCFPPSAERPADYTTAPVHVFIAICDHFEPENGGASKGVGIERVERWCRDYPRLFSQFHDSRGRVPQHTFFFPQDEYAPEYLDRLAELCKAGFGDVDVHLHHDNDTAEGLREKLDEFRETLYHRHGLLRRDPVTDEIVYGFIHGNWALCNSRPDGRWCGVDAELPVLLETGCYADFTMPSAPTDTQTRTINSIYYASDRPGWCKSHDTGVRARVGLKPPDDSLLMIQGPLSLDWRGGRGVLGAELGARSAEQKTPCSAFRVPRSAFRRLLPRIENGDIHGGRPPSWERMQQWLRAGVHVAGRPDWLFVKLHTHGCKEGNIETLLGNRTQQFHRELAAFSAAHRNFRYHYVTAWEMAQLVHQAEGGATMPEFDAVTSHVAARGF